MPLLENDPTVALKERWDIKNNTRCLVFEKSFSNPNVKYNDDELEEIYQTCPSVREYVFRCKSCSKEFLARHFDEEFERSKNWALRAGLVNIVDNPNTPIELIEKVASAKDHSGQITTHAQKVLVNRQSELVAQPTINSPSVSP
jgi:hypothetical protein